MKLRPSCREDVPALKQLWKLAFGDEDAYIEHFFGRYHTPERMLVLEENGVVCAMTAWFDMPLVGKNGAHVPAAYLYAVATHPDCRGRGLAGQLLDFAGQWLGEQGFACLTTVPAREDLHVFFARNGFEEGFVLSRQEYGAPAVQIHVALAPVDSKEYGRLREDWLAGRAHVSCAPEALDYQQGVCALCGGGLYRVGEKGCACVEVGEQTVYIKELLADCVPEAVAAIAARHPAKCYEVRTPWEGEGAPWDFALLRPLASIPEWDGKGSAYLGLAFD